VINSPRPLAVASAVRSQISCTAVINGKVNRLVHNRPKPVAAPACEYVAIPDGPSSLAPVTSPGPNARR
jgi:hypothetical protein